MTGTLTLVDLAKIGVFIALFAGFAAGLVAMQYDALPLLVGVLW